MVRIAVLFAVLTLVLASCTSQAAPETPVGDSSPSRIAFGDSGDTLRLAMVEPPVFEPSTLDLADQPQVILSDLLYDGLTEADARSGTLRPGLAKRWSADESFSSWTFFLDSNRVTASTVKESFERARRHSSVVIRNLMSEVTDIEVTSDAEVVFTLRNPNAGWAWIVSGPGFAVAGDDGAHTGLYKTFSEDVNGVVLSGSDGLSDVSVRWADTSESAFALVEDELVDVAVGSLGTALPRDDVQEDSLLGHTRFLALNTRTGSLSDPQTRATLRSAVKTDTSSTAEDGLVPISGLTSPALSGSTSKACQQLCPDSLEVDTVDTSATLTFGFSDEDDSDRVESIASDLRGVGFDVRVVRLSPDSLAAQLVSGSVDLFMFGWLAAAGSVDAVLPSLLHSESPANVFQLADGEVDERIWSGARMGDDLERWSVLGEVEEQALSQHLVVPLGAFRSTVFRGNEVSGLVVRTDGSLDMFRY